MEEVHEIARVGFNSQPDAYERSRPTYPPSSLDSIFEIIRQKNLQEGENFDNIKILDLAAGTGKFTRLLLKYFTDNASKNTPIVAIEPAEEMSKQFRKIMPNWVPILSGTSTKLPFEDNSFDVVTIAQAFHWFSNIESLREIRRILKKNGTLFLIWNLEDSSVEWIQRLRDEYEVYDKDVPQYRKGLWKKVFFNENIENNSENNNNEDENKIKCDKKLINSNEETKKLFGDLNENFFKWSSESNIDLVWERILSKSYISCLTSDEQNNVKERIEKIVLDHFNGAENDRKFQLPVHFVTEVCWLNAV